MNKNQIIGVLAALLVLASLWGQVGNRSGKETVQELHDLETELTQARDEAAKSHAAVQVKSKELANAQEMISKQAKKGREKLVELRKASKALEATLSKRNSVIAALEVDLDKLAKEKKHLLERALRMKKRHGEGSEDLIAKFGAMEKALAENQTLLAQKDEELATAAKAVEDAQASGNTADQKVIIMELEEKLGQAVVIIEDQQAQIAAQQAKMDEQDSEAAQAALAAAEGEAQAAEATANEAAGKLTRISIEYESLRAQVIGLEKIVEEKNATIEETSNELDNWKVNMKVLLGRIADQEDTMQEMKEESYGLVKELAAKNQELADLNEQLIQTPVQ